MDTLQLKTDFERSCAQGTGSEESENTEKVKQ